MCQQRKSTKERACNPCPACKGKGYIKVPLRHGSVFTRRVACPACLGAGVNCNPHS